MSYLMNSKQIKSIIYAIFAGIIVFFIYIISKRNCSYDWCQVILFFVALFIYFFMIVSNYKKLGNKFDCFTLFLIAAFPFSFGRHILCILGLKDFSSAFSYSLKKEILIEAGYYNIYAVLALYIGYNLISSKKKKRTKKNINELEQENKILRIVAIILFFVTIPFYVYGRYQDMQITLLKGYGARIVEGNNVFSVSGLFASFALPASTAMYITRKEKEKLSILCLISIYVMDLLAGSRITVICSLFVVFYHYYATHKINFRRFLYIVVGLIIILSVFTMVSASRSAIASNESVIDFVIHNNVIISALDEVGFTFETSANVIQHCPKDVKHINGLSYLYALIYVLPNKFTGVKFIDTDSAFASYLVSYGGIGSSYSAEAFYNFGYGGLFAIIAIGSIWGWLSRELTNSLKNNDKLENFWLMQIAFALFIMLRSDMVYRFRSLVWFNVPIIAITVIIGNRKKHTYNNS